MRGNIYISVPTADIDNALPTTITRYDWQEYTYTEEGEVDTTTTIHPTWAQYGKKYEAVYGAPVTAGDHTVYEMTASWVDSEVSALIALGASKSFPDYTVMTNEEAREFIKVNSEQL